MWLINCAFVGQKNFDLNCSTVIDILKIKIKKKVNKERRIEKGRKERRIL
jgi:hypothetical protein